MSSSCATYNENLLPSSTLKVLWARNLPFLHRKRAVRSYIKGAGAT